MAVSAARGATGLWPGSDSECCAGCHGAMTKRDGNHGMAKYVITAVALVLVCALMSDNDNSWRSHKRIHHKEVHRSAGEYPAAQFNSQAQKVAEKEAWKKVRNSITVEEEARNKKAPKSRKIQYLSEKKALLVESGKIRFLNAEFYQSRWEPFVEHHGREDLFQRRPKCN